MSDTNVTKQDMDILQDHLQGAEANTTSAILVRTIRDAKNKDGWSARSLKEGRLCFINNLDAVLETMEAGQLWEAAVLDSKAKFDLVDLIHCVKA